jgi:hypothetical protein
MIKICLNQDMEIIKIPSLIINKHQKILVKATKILISHILIESKLERIKDLKTPSSKNNNRM